MATNNYTVSGTTATALRAYQLSSDLYDAVFNMLLDYHKENNADNPDELTEETMKRDIYPHFVEIDNYIKKFIHDNIEANISKPDFSEV